MYSMQFANHRTFVRLRRCPATPPPTSPSSCDAIACCAGCSDRLQLGGFVLALLGVTVTRRLERVQAVSNAFQQVAISQVGRISCSCDAAQPRCRSSPVVDLTA